MQPEKPVRQDEEPVHRDVQQGISARGEQAEVVEAGRAGPATPAAKGPALGRAWKTAFLLGGSILLGAAAVALWNRRSLAKLQEQARQDDAR